MKNTISRIIILTLFIMTAITMTAQKSDGFFRYNEDLYQDRDAEFTGVGNQPFGEKPVSVGSGLLLLVAAGAGYAVARRKKARRNTTALLLASVMLLGMTQCKKNIDNIVVDNNNKVHITVNVGNGSRHEIIPNEEGYVPVRYEVGDVIYVGDGSQYIGTLTCTAESDEDGNDATFQGEIDQPNVDDVLHLYFVGGLTPQNFGSGNASLAAGETSFIVDITNQKDKLPVLSYTTVVYSGNNLSCTLNNKCALVEFKFADGTDKKVKVSNMLCEAKIDFAHPGITPTEKLDAITLYNQVSDNDDNTKKWAVLLLSDTQRKSTGMVYNKTETYNSTKVDIYDYYDGVVVPALTESNNYLYGTSARYVNNSVANINNKVFVVSANGNAVRFAPGVLKCTKTGDTWDDGYEWGFLQPTLNMASTWNNFNVGNDCSNTDVIFHFCWGNTGYQDTEHPQPSFKPYNTVFSKDNYGPTGLYNLSVKNRSDWGAVIPNPEEYNWRLLTREEAEYMMNNRNNALGRKGTVQIGPNTGDYLNGWILFPENWTNTSGFQVLSTPNPWYTNTMTDMTELNTFLANNPGAVFLPAIGVREFTGSTPIIASINSKGQYWVADYSDSQKAYYLGLTNSTTSTTNNWRGLGKAVILVR